jgi:uncharacterized protein with NRDE domain
MCLLIVLSRVRDDLPLVVAANRDERLERPATAMTVLRDDQPRMLGGRDEQAGGTWFALNEGGVFAGLTNRPPSSGRYPAKATSRGELPLALARHDSAARAVDVFAATFRPADYNPAWILVGDREDLFAVDMTGKDRPTVNALPPGLHIVENHPPGTETPKVVHVRHALAGVEALPVEDLVPRLEVVVADHHAPATGDRAALSAACVHADGYGTRWSGVVTVPRARGVRPSFRYADGPPCRVSFVEAEWDLRR